MFAKQTHWYFMKTLLAIIFTISGITLLALDRIIKKTRVIKLDKKLAEITGKFKPLKSKYLAAGILFPIGLISGTVALRISLFEASVYYDSPLLDELAHAPLIVLVIILIILLALLWLIEGTVVGLSMYVKGKDEMLSSVGRIPFFAGFMTLILSLIMITSFLHFLLYPIIYPLKGILILNNKWFNSFSGLIGLILAIIGTILQFI